MQIDPTDDRPSLEKLFVHVPPQLAPVITPDLMARQTALLQFMEQQLGVKTLYTEVQWVFRTFVPARVRRENLPNADRIEVTLGRVHGGRLSFYSEISAPRLRSAAELPGDPLNAFFGGEVWVRIPVAGYSHQQLIMIAARDDLAARQPSH